MGKIIERSAGIDIGKCFLLCCVMTGAAHEEPRSETRRFDTFNTTVSASDWYWLLCCSISREGPSTVQRSKAWLHSMTTTFNNRVNPIRGKSEKATMLRKGAWCCCRTCKALGDSTTLAADPPDGR